jgi:hypothetical protein
LSGIIRPIGTPNIVDADVFPPPRSQAPDPSIFLPYITEDIAFEEEYEEYLSDLGWSDPHHSADGPLFGGTSAWSRLPTFASEMADGMSDSESIVSIGDLGDERSLDVGRDDRDSVDENRNDWAVSFLNNAFLTRGTDHGGLSTASEPQDDGGIAKVARGSTPLECRGWPTPCLAIWTR